MQWRILRLVRFAKREIKIRDIQEVRRFELKDILSGGQIFGNFFIKEGVIVVLRKGIFRKIFITPENADEFVQQLSKKVSNSEHDIKTAGIKSPYS